MSLLILFNNRPTIQPIVSTTPSQQRVYNDFYFSPVKIQFFFQNGAFGSQYFGNMYFGEVVESTSVIVPRDSYTDLYSP